MPPDVLAAARRILVMRPDNIGDVVLTGPLFRSLQRHVPGAILGLLASPAGASAAPLLPWVDEVVEARPVWQDLGGRLPLDPQRELAFIERLAAGHWDAAVIATSHRQTSWPPAYAAYLAGIPVRAGYAPDFGGSVLSHPIEPPPAGTHAARRNLALAAGLGVAVDEDAVEVVVPPRDRLAVRRTLGRQGIEPGTPILVLPGASAPARRIEPERLGAAAALLAADTGRPIVVAGTAVEEDLVARCMAAAPGSRSPGMALTVPEFAALVEASALVLSNNSAGLHLAEALAVPVVAAYAGTDPRSLWEPRSTPSALLSIDVPCAPCYRIECPFGNACLDLVPEDIAAAAGGLLRARRERGSVACAA